MVTRSCSLARDIIYTRRPLWEPVIERFEMLILGLGGLMGGKIIIIRVMELKDRVTSRE